MTRRIRPPTALLLVSGSPALCETRWFEGDGDALAASVAARRQRLGLREHADEDCPPSHGRCLAERLGAPWQVQGGVGHALLSEAPAAVVHALDVLTAMSENR